LKTNLAYFYFKNLCIKIVALRINRYTRSSSQFQKGWWPLVYRKESFPSKESHIKILQSIYFAY